MCGRYSIRNPRHPWLGEIPPELAQPRYNVAPSQRILVVGRDREGERQARPAVWGFRPKWLAEDRRAPINARAETAATTPMFRNAFRHGRCLVPADGWYEWQPQERGPKQPYFFHRPDDGLFWFAGLAATSPDGELTVAIVTTNANEVTRPIHSRMPLMLPDDETGATWIDPEADRDTLQALLAPPTVDTVATYPVSRRVNKPEHDDAACVAPADP